MGRRQADTLGHFRRPELIGGNQQTYEFLAAEPRRQVKGTRQRLQGFRHGHQGPVTGFVPVTVIDAFEMVDIDHQQGGIGTVSFAALEFRFGDFGEGPSVGQAGQWIGSSQFLEPRLGLTQLFFQPHPVGNVAHARHPQRLAVQHQIPPGDLGKKGLTVLAQLFDGIGGCAFLGDIFTHHLLPFRGQQLHERFPQKFRFAIAKHPTKRAIDVDDVGSVVNDDALEGQLRQSGIAGFALAESGLETFTIRQIDKLRQQMGSAVDVGGHHAHIQKQLLAEGCGDVHIPLSRLMIFKHLQTGVQQTGFLE